MTLHLDPVLLTGFLLAATRAAAFIVVAPPFNSSAINGRVKAGLAVALGLAMAPSFHGSQALLENLWSFLGALIGQVALGVALGFAVLVLLSAVQAAGSLVDVSVGFSAATQFDPLSNAVASPFGRLYQVLGTAVLFAINGHLLIVKGLLASFDVQPAGELNLANAAQVAIHDVTLFFVSAVQIALPLTAAMLITEIGLGLLSKAAPQMNVLVIGFAVKIGAVLLLAGFAIRLIPTSVTRLLDDALRSMASLVGG